MRPGPPAPTSAGKPRIDKKNFRVRDIIVTNMPEGKGLPTKDELLVNMEIQPGRFVAFKQLKNDIKVGSDTRWVDFHPLGGPRTVFGPFCIVVGPSLGLLLMCFGQVLWANCFRAFWNCGSRQVCFCGRGFSWAWS